MFRKLIRTEAVAIGERLYDIRYYELTTLRGGRRYSSEVLLNAGDRIILDDDSLANLESRVARVVPTTVYSRVLLAAGSAA